MIAPDYALMVARWLQNEIGEEANICFQNTAEPDGCDDAAFRFTITVPSRHLDRLYLIQKRTGRIWIGKSAIRVTLIEGIEVISCKGALARRDFIVNIREER